MTNPLKGEARLQLNDGRSLALVLDFDGLIAAEQAYGKPLARLMAEAGEGFMGALRAILWGALQRHHADMTMAEVGEIMLGSQQSVMAAVESAIDASMPASGSASGSEGDNAGNAGNRPAGKRSGRSGAKRG